MESRVRVVTQVFTGNGLLARAMRSSALTVAGFGGSQVLRLVSNLVLARLLFPEAFGIMAIVSVIIQGLMQFSDVGVSPAIMQSKRGDDPDFLNTAWTIQMMRGLGLWLAACALAWPVAQIYDSPLLMQLLPVAGLSLLITGFNPTRLDSAKRHLRFGRVTVIDFTELADGNSLNHFVPVTSPAAIRVLNGIISQAGRGGAGFIRDMALALPPVKAIPR